MKKNILLIVAIALVGTATITMNSLRAQDQPTPGGPPPSSQTPPPGGRPGGPPPGFRGRPGASYRQAIGMLKRVKMDLERSKEDFDGHRQSAMDACDKAVQELEAVQASIQAKQEAEAAARAAAQQTNAPQTPAPAPATAPPQ